MDNNIRYFPCICCSKQCETRLARKCDACFESGKNIEPPRQSGRTFGLIKEAEKNERAILVVHNQTMKQNLECSYPWLHNRIRSVHEEPHWMRSMSGNDVLVDHCVTEFWNSSIDRFMRDYKMILAPGKLKGSK
jgi:hypothetical protein